MRWEWLFTSLDLIFLVKAFYLLAALAITFVRFVSPLRNRYLDYGARSFQQNGSRMRPSSASSVQATLDSLAQVRVPHNRFMDFYCLSLFCVAFWVWQIYSDGIMYELMISSMHSDRREVPPIRTYACFLLLAIQSVRRFYECTIVSSQGKPSSSSMWIGHYLIGLAFYFFISIAVFIEQAKPRPMSKLGEDMSTVSFTTFSKDTFAIAVFAVASIAQHWYHSYLASLKKYTLPERHAFEYIIAPHYAAECLVYLALSMLSAPSGSAVNKTVGCALIFVVVNLGVTADGTKQWMLLKFPEHRRKIQRRWRMIPWLF